MLLVCLMSPNMTASAFCEKSLFHARYSEAIEICTDKEALKRLYSNRALAFTKTGRFAEALQDAEKAIALSPAWDKAYLRQGAALQGLKKHAEAAQAFRIAWQLIKGKQMMYKPNFDL